MEEKKGPDLSSWNIGEDYDAIRMSGVDFAILKVINKQNKADSRFYEHVSGLNNAGIPIIGGYTYSYADTVEKAKAAADAFVEVGYPKGIDTMWLDLEDKVVTGLGSAILNIIETYRIIANSAGMKFGIYTGASYYNPNLKAYAKELDGIPFWWARYPSTKERNLQADVPDTRYLPTGIDIDGWQYSSKGIIPGIKGYVDLNTWYETEPFINENNTIPVNANPFTEPLFSVRIGAMGNDARWVQWYCWRFGCFTDDNGQPDDTQIDGIFGPKTEAAVKKAQAILGLEPDGIVGSQTKVIWKKIC